MSKACRTILLLVPVLAVVCAAVGFFAPRQVIIESNGSSVAGLEVSLIGGEGSQINQATMTTDARGVATLGRGPWKWPWRHRALLSVRVRRGGKILRDGLLESPVFGPLRVSVSD